MKVLRKTAMLMVVALAISGCFLVPPDINLAGLQVAGYSLDREFDPEVTEYQAIVPYSVNSVAVSAALSSALAKLSYSVPDNGAVPLAVGPNVIRATIEAPDASARKTYTLTVYRCNTNVQVLDSVNGSLLPASGVTWKVYDGAILLNTFKGSANPQFIYVEPGKARKIEVSVEGRAASSKEGIVVGSGENNLVPFVSQKSGMSSFPAVAPVLGNLEFTMSTDPDSDTATWFPIVSGVDLNLTGIKAFRVTVSGDSEIEPTSWSGDGVTLGIDLMPYSFQLGQPVMSSKTSYDAATGKFTAKALFAGSSVSLRSGAHSFTIVVYDRANNRVEKTFNVNITSTPAPGADISAAYFQSLSAEIRTYGLSREYLGAGPAPDGMPVTSTGGTSYRSTVAFKLQSASTGGSAIPVLGYDVYRSTDGVNFRKIGSMNYGTLSTGVSGLHTFHDVDSSLAVGTQYWYKVVAFTDDTHTKESALMTTMLLPPFTASLVAPAHEGIVDVSESFPDYSFSISDPTVLSYDVADRMYFAPALREKDGPYAYYGEFIYLFGPTPLLAFRSGSSLYDVVGSFGGTLADYIVFDGGKVTLKAALLNNATNYYGMPITYKSGVSYDWDMFGNYTAAGNLGSSSGMNPIYLQKTLTNGVARSYADIYQKGNQTLNGWFEFTVK